MSSVPKLNPSLNHHASSIMPTIEVKNIPNIPSKELKFTTKIGEGTFGEVYIGKWKKAKDVNEVAIKKLLVKNLPEDLLEEFKKEAGIMAACSQCQQIVNIFGICIEENNLAMVLQYMNKGGLNSVLQSKEDLPWKPIRYRIAIDIGKGLNFLHSVQIIHRDLKSLNVLLDAQYNAKICDFGISKIQQHTMLTLTNSKAPAGTILWHAPEMWDGFPTHTYKTDVYAYGMILWEIGTRKYPFPGMDYFQLTSIHRQKIQEKIPPEWPEDYRRVIEWAWALQPEQRPSAKQMYEVLAHTAPNFYENKPLPRNSAGKIPPQRPSRPAPSNMRLSNNIGKLPPNVPMKQLPPTPSYNQQPLKNDNLSLKNPKKPNASPQMHRNFSYNIPRRSTTEMNIVSLQQAADKGSIPAKYELGRRHFEGIETPKNYTSAVYFWDQAANRRHPQAQYWYSICLFNGHGVDIDHLKAINFMNSAADLGLPEAQIFMADCYLEGKKFFNNRNKKKIVIKKDVDLALNYYKLAAEKGSIEAQVKLGHLYYAGKTVKKDYSEALKYYKLAASQGDQVGQLGVKTVSKILNKDKT